MFSIVRNKKEGKKRAEQHFVIWKEADLFNFLYLVYFHSVYMTFIFIYSKYILLSRYENFTCVACHEFSEVLGKLKTLKLVSF